MKSDSIICDIAGVKLPNSARSRRSLRYAIVVAGIISVVLLLVRMDRAIQQRIIQAKTTARFQQIAIALTNYSFTMACHEYDRVLGAIPQQGRSYVSVSNEDGLLPPAVGRREFGPSVEDAPDDRITTFLCSWRMTLLPYLCGTGDSVDYDQPWDVPKNFHELKRYRFFTYPRSWEVWDVTGRVPSDPMVESNALAITGPGTAFGDGSKPPMKMKNIPADTILIVEVRTSGIPWPAPGDLDIRTMQQGLNAVDGKGISGQYGRFHVIWGDRQVWLLSEQVPFAELKKFFTVDGASKYDREQLLAPYVLGRFPQD